MEQYFSSLTPSSLQDNFAVAIFKTCLKEGLRALHHPSDYEARANLMWASSWCEEGVIACGHNYAWVVHPLEHPLSGHFNVTHGAGLSVLTPVYFSYILNRKNAKRFAAFGEEVFSLSKEDNDPYKIKEAEKFIECLKDLFFNSFSLPSSLKDLKVDPHLFKKMAQEALDGKKTIGDFVPLKEEDIVAIYKKAYR
jgi:alcohol dehydrogenase YqhD (iron-dependent ADH family)